jgi:nucleotide-binding universal stress UspA family protein
MHQDLSRQSQQGPIVVGVDGSPASKNALRWALAHARRTGSSVEAIMVWQDSPVFAGYGWIPIATAGDDLAAAADAVLWRTLAEVLGEARHTLAVRARVVHGYPVETLLAASRTAQILVVGSRGHGTVAGILTGSVSRHCIRHAACPVLVMPAASLPPASPARPRPGVGRWADADPTECG